jgi:hypothetical protein
LGFARSGSVGSAVSARAIGLAVMLALAVVPRLAGAAVAEWSRDRIRIELEGGPAWQTRNDVRIPGDTGTKFSLLDLGGRAPFAAGRLTVDLRLGDRSELRLLLAPLTLRTRGTLPMPVDFAGRTYAADLVTDATYRFNSWRLTYRRTLHEGNRFRWRLGFTAKIRDAKVALSQLGAASEKTNVGFVPLLHAQGQCRVADRTRLELTADGLAAPQGRAFDISLQVCRDLGDNMEAALGYRTLEGGADVDEVFTFAWLHYAAASLAWRY